MSFLKNFQDIFDVSLNKYLNYKERGAEQLKVAFRGKLEELIKSNSADIFEHFDEMEAFSNKFGDFNSDLVFAAEVNFLIFSRLDQNFAAKYISPFSSSCYATLNELYDEFMRSKYAPKFEQVENSDMSIPITTTFILRQYAYDKPSRKEGKFEIEPGEIVLNCGACTGDSAIWFYQEGAAQVHNFEPVPDAFAQLQKNLELNDLPTDYSYLLAVGNQNCEIQFLQTLCHIGASYQLELEKGLNSTQQSKLKHSQEQAQSSQENNANYKIVTAQCVVLDEWLSQQCIVPTYIKMDLEGAEPEALAGLTKTISTYKPKLAICLYHRPSDMWTIPQQILSMNPDYTFYCKKSASTTEFVLFAVPNKD